MERISIRHGQRDDGEKESETRKRRRDSATRIPRQRQGQKINPSTARTQRPCQTRPVGDTIAWPTARAAKEAHCSKTLIAPLMKQLVSLGALTLIQAGKVGRNSGRAAIYRREV